MLPQDSYRSPARAQRFIELHNVGSVEIPGFAVVEVIESSRPEKGGTVTPGGGRTVLHVRLAETDDPCTTVVNGACEIPPDGWGKPGTLDDPMLALVAEDYPNGTDVGVAEGSFFLTEGHCGYRIYGGDFDATTQTQRVIRTDDCQDSMMVRATECILPGQGGEVQPQQWNSVSGCWEDSSAAAFDIIDPQGWLLAVPGDCFKVDRQSRCGTTGRSDFMPSFPFGMTQLVRVLTKIDCGGCGEVTIVRKQIGGSASLSGEHCDTVATECTFQACNMSYRPISCDAQEYAIAHIIPGQCCIGSDTGSGEAGCLAFLMPYPRAMFGMGKLAADLCEGNAEIVDAQWLDVCAQGGFDPPTTAGNREQLHACSGTNVLFFWTAQSDGVDSCGAEIIQVSDYELPDWVIDLRCPTDLSCGVEKSVKEKPRYGHFCNCTQDPEGQDEWDSTQLGGEYVDVIISGEVEDDIGTSTEVLTGADCGEGSCQLVFATTGLKPTKAVFKTKQVCVFCQPTSPGDGDDIEITGLVGIGAAGTPKTITGKEIDVLTEAKVEYDAGSGGTGEGCPSGSGSASATITVKGKTKTICTFCSEDDGAGDFVDGADIDLLDGLSFGYMVAVSEADFTCEPCPAMSTKCQTGYVLCVTAESAALVVSCECDPCVTGSGSGS